MYEVSADSVLIQPNKSNTEPPKGIHALNESQATAKKFALRYGCNFAFWPNALTNGEAQIFGIVLMALIKTEKAVENRNIKNSACLVVLIFFDNFSTSSSI